MKQMEPPTKPYSLWHHLVAVGRDALTISAVVSLLATAFWFVAKPYLSPYLDTPKVLGELRKDIVALQIQLADTAQPRIVEFQGIGLVTGEDSVRAGDRITILYNLRRNASCATEIEVAFIDVSNGTRIVTHIQRAVQAPVSDSFAPFLINLQIPAELPPGRYSYQPRISPIDCGVYKSYLGTMTSIFRVE